MKSDSDLPQLMYIMWTLHIGAFIILYNIELSEAEAAKIWFIALPNASAFNESPFGPRRECGPNTRFHNSTIQLHLRADAVWSTELFVVVECDLHAEVLA
jgi:hypothetical protein